MSDNHANSGATALDSALASSTERGLDQESIKGRGFIQRYRLPLLLAVVAVCLYAGSILYILFGRGQIA